MKASQPAQTKHTTPWGGESFPPPRFTGEKQSILPLPLDATPLPAESPAQQSPAAPMRRERSWIVRQLLILVCVLAFSVPAYYLASRFVVTAVVIQGRSMSPTLKDGERYYLNRWRYLFVPPARGDLVVIQDPGHSDFAVKRIVAKPGDWLNLRDGKLFLNGKRLDEPYLPAGTRTEVPDRQERWIHLGESQYYMLGDNRGASEDSRYYGVIDRDHIVGVLVK